jgi:hypothetical protein
MGYLVDGVVVELIRRDCFISQACTRICRKNHGTCCWIIDVLFDWFTEGTSGGRATLNKIESFIIYHGLKSKKISTK